MEAHIFFLIFCMSSWSICDAGVVRAEYRRILRIDQRVFPPALDRLLFSSFHQSFILNWFRLISFRPEVYTSPYTISLSNLS